MTRCRLVIPARCSTADLKKLPPGARLGTTPMRSGVAFTSGKSRPVLAVGRMIDEIGTPTAFWNRAQGWRTAPTLGRGYERDVNPNGVVPHRPFELMWAKPNDQ